MEDASDKPMPICVTMKMNPGEMIRTNVGLVSARAWCKSEVARMTANGATVKMEESQATENKSALVWITRDASEVKPLDDED